MNYVELNLAEISGNPVDSFSINIDTQRYENYEIGNFYPTEVGIMYPIKISYAFDLYPKDINILKNYSYYYGFDLRTINLKFYNRNSNTILRSLDFSGVKLDTEKLSLELNDNGKLSLNFSTFILSGEI